MFRIVKGEIVAKFAYDQADLLRNLIAEYIELIDSDASAGDPVIARLYPSAALDDPRVDAAYQELVHDDLAQHKKRTARLALASLGESGAWRGALTPEMRDAWLVLLTDLRLSIGVRLGVTEEIEKDLPDPNDPENLPITVFHYLGFLQETLVEASQKKL